MDPEQGVEAICPHMTMSGMIDMKDIERMAAALTAAR